MPNRNLLLVVALVGLSTTAGAAEAPTSPAKIENFSLRDYRGKLHALADYADSKCVVVAFVGVDCPLARLVAPRLARMSRDFQEQGVTFLAIDANSQDSLSRLAQFAREHDLPFPVLKDPGNAVADRFGTSARRRSFCSTKSVRSATTAGSTTRTWSAGSGRIRRATI